MLIWFEFNVILKINTDKLTTNEFHFPKQTIRTESGAEKAKSYKP